MNYLTPRTYQSVNRALTNVGRSNRITKANDMSFLTCRYEPFTAQGMPTMKKPDGQGRHTVQTDYLLTADFVTAPTGTFLLTVLPALPTPLAVTAAATGATLNGTAIPAGTRWAITNTSLNSNLGPSALLPLSSRLTTIGWRMYYTGPASAATGIITADSFGTRFDTDPAIARSKMQYLDILNNSQTVDFNLVAGTTLGIVEFTASNPDTSKSRVSLRPESGASGTLKRSTTSTTHEFKPMYEGGFYIGGNTGDLTVNFNSPFNGPFVVDSMATNNPPKFTFFDHDFDSTNIVLNCASSQFRFEMIICLESELRTQHPLYPLSSPSPAVNKQVLALDDTINTTLPPAKPLTSISVGRRPRPINRARNARVKRPLKRINKTRRATTVRSIRRALISRRRANRA